jgi:hypothetical protein
VTDHTEENVWETKSVLFFLTLAKYSTAQEMAWTETEADLRR